MHCKDCAHRADGYCDSGKLVESFDEDCDSDDQMVYSYQEGGAFKVQDYFGCVHFKEKESYGKAR